MKRQTFGLLRGLPDLPQSLYQHLHFEGPFEVQVDPTHKFRIHSHGNHVENELFWRGYGGSWEGMSLHVWAALCRTRAGLAIDVGANSGVYTLAAAALGKNVAAFEPVSRIADRLRHNVALNRFPIRVEQKAVSDRTGRLPIYDVMIEHNYSASLEGQGPDAACYEVDVCTLDGFLDDLEWPGVAALKIDVERHEPSVLRGMHRLLTEQQPPMLVEILDRTIGAEVKQLLAGLDYRIFHVDELKGLIPTEVPEPVGDHNWNHLFCTEEQCRAANIRGLLAG